MNRLDLGGEWQMRRAGSAEWLPATVPGSVYGDLLAAGRMEDPFFRDNEAKALALSEHDYEYRRTFSLTAEQLRHDRLVLRCEGLDTLCDVFLNGAAALTGEDMHRTYEISVRRMLREGENEIRILFHSPVAYCRKMQQEFPLINSSDAVEGISHLRKAHCMSGWDWGPKLPDMGIWRPIYLDAYDGGRLEDLYIAQRHEAGRVTLDVRTRANIWGGGGFRLRVRLTGPEGGTTEVSAGAAPEEGHIALEVPHPRLWWPRGLGAQPLYTLRADLIGPDGAVADSSARRIGLRTMEIRREKDQWGESFAFTVNGTPVFAMGADYIPEDNILSRCSRARTARLLRSCVQANFNTVRVWGGGYYPEDYFYDLCDEYGLIVWQDMMFACGVYRLTPAFEENIIRETEDNIRRLRHHPSLGLWCGNNEQEAGWAEWGWASQASSALRADYTRQYEVLFPGIVRREDPAAFYWPSSPSSGGGFDHPNGESRGDMHYWEVWHGRKPFTAYRDVFPRFMSEFGLQSFPCLKTVETFTLPEDRNIFSYVMESHQKNGTGNETIFYYIGQNFRMPKDFDSLLYVSQLIQAEGMRYGVEHWRRCRGRCMGTIYWQLNDCWPVASWSSVDYFGRWKTLQYAARRFFAPVLASACEEGTAATLHVTNETPAPVAGTLAWRLLDTAGQELEAGKTQAEIPAFASRQCAALDFAARLDTPEKRRRSVLAYRFAAADGRISAGTVLFCKPKHFTFLDPRIAVTVGEEPDVFTLRLRAQAYARAVELSLDDADGIFGDNYFDLPAGEEKTVRLPKGELSRPLTAENVHRGLRVRSLYDSYAHG